MGLTRLDSQLASKLVRKLAGSQPCTQEPFLVSFDRGGGRGVEWSRRSLSHRGSKGGNPTLLQPDESGWRGTTRCRVRGYVWSSATMVTYTYTYTQRCGGKSQLLSVADRLSHCLVCVCALRVCVLVCFLFVLVSIHLFIQPVGDLWLAVPIHSIQQISHVNPTTPHPPQKIPPVVLPHGNAAADSPDRTESFRGKKNGSGGGGGSHHDLSVGFF